MEARDPVDGRGDDEGDREGPARGGADVGKLFVELPIVVIDPAAGDDAGVDAVEADDVGCAKQGIGHQTKHAGDGVFGEDVKGIIDFQQVFDCVRRKSSSLAGLSCTAQLRKGTWMNGSTNI